jgi:ABC-type sugar transport system permease subunit
MVPLVTGMRGVLSMVLKPREASGTRPSAQRRGGRMAVRKTLRKPQFWFGLSVLGPTMIWYGIFGLWPVLSAFWISVVNYKLMDPLSSPFVGLDNFHQTFDNFLFPIAVKNTLTWAVLQFVVMLPVALLISLFLASVVRGRNIYQALIFLPVVIPLVAVSLLFRMLLDPDVGQIDTVLSNFNLPNSPFLNDMATALPTAVGIAVWKSMGFYIVILTAGILNIPRELNEAALVDGANKLQCTWRITLPLLGHTMALITVLLMINGVQEFTLPFILTSGGPNNATYLLNLFIYNEAFTNLHFGIATAAALLEFILILVISLIQLRLLRPKWSY